jgi:hypothetical protein
MMRADIPLITGGINRCPSPVTTTTGPHRFETALQGTHRSRQHAPRLIRRLPCIVGFDAASVVPHDETPKAPAGDALARIMHDLAVEPSCHH